MNRVNQCVVQLHTLIAVDDICSRVCTENDITKWGMTYKSDSEKPVITAMSTLG